MDKQALKSRLLSLLSTKISALVNDLEEIKAGLADNTKSTAGDKHETSRAMAHLEQEKLGTQLMQLKEQESILTAIDCSITSIQVEPGSFVQTDSGSFFVTIPLGEIKENPSFFAVSAASPLIQKMLGKSVGDVIEMNGRTITITAIL